MIPKDSTPIKNEILIDIIAKGLLNKDEMRIIAYIIRWSWGFNGEGRRQDWTKKLNKRKITNDIGMKESQLNRIINKMIKENKIITKDKCYQFNEHYEKWENLTKSKVFNERKLNKKLSKTSQIVKENLTKSKVKLNNLLSLDIPNNSGDSIKNKDLKGGEHLSKETLKDNKDNKYTTLRFQIIEYLNLCRWGKNLKSNKGFKHNNPNTIKLINARIKEGFTLEDFKYVIEVKCLEWKDKINKEGKNCEDWLRPITLFGTKFESYLNQAKPDPYEKYYRKE